MKKTFFSHDKNFYAALFPLLIIISLQNLISYSVNMADNIMLGAYRSGVCSFWCSFGESNIFPYPTGSGCDR